MNKLKIKCPSCGKSLQVDEAATGHQTNCPHCHQIFIIEHPAPPPSAQATWLTLGFDAGMNELQLACYEALAHYGINSNSKMEEIQRVFPDTDEEYEERERLFKLQSRLVVDLFRYPLWEKETT
jgi:hypothetical protein